MKTLSKWKRHPHLRLAIFVSLALHTALGLLLWVLPMPKQLPMSAKKVKLPPLPVALSAEGCAVLVFPPAPTRCVAPRNTLGPQDTMANSFQPILDPVIPPEHGDPQPATPPKIDGPNPLQAIPRTKPQPKNGTSFFGLQTGEKAGKIVYVLDRSSSMGQFGIFSHVRRELLGSLHQLPETAQFQVIHFNKHTDFLLPQHTRWLVATESNKNRAAAQLYNLHPRGETVHNMALPLALSLAPDVIFFLTDADGVTADFARKITRLNGNHVVIHVIQINMHGNQVAHSSLQYLARENHGKHRMWHFAFE